MSVSFDSPSLAKFLGLPLGFCATMFIPALPISMRERASERIQLSVIFIFICIH